MWNPTSLNTSPKEDGLLVKVVPKNEHRNYVNPLASIPMGATYFKNYKVNIGQELWGQHSSKTRRCSRDTPYAKCIMIYNIKSTLVILPSICWKGHSSI